MTVAPNEWAVYLRISEWYDQYNYVNVMKVQSWTIVYSQEIWTAYAQYIAGMYKIDLVVNINPS